MHANAPIAALSRAQIIACAVACGAMVANLYYAQPLIGLIAPQLGLGGGVAGMIVTLTQLGYGLGLVLLVPLADRFENRRLILGSLIGTAAALALVAAAPGAGLFLAGSCLVGICAAGAQIVVPFAASLAPAERRGSVVGDVMAGLLAGIMLARPGASFVASIAGWRAIFWISSGLMLALALWLARVLPARRPPAGTGYAGILRGMRDLLLRCRPLQRRAAYQGLCFAVFNIFWTASPLLLTHRLGFGQRGIALFALAGAGGALAAPLAGRMGDRGYVRLGTAAALVTLTLSCLAAGWSGAAGILAGLVAFAITLDAATQVNQVLGQKLIYSLPVEGRGQINAVYMTAMFLLGASGSTVATAIYDSAGWWPTMAAAAGIGALAIALFATESLDPKASPLPAS